MLAVDAQGGPAHQGVKDTIDVAWAATPRAGGECPGGEQGAQEHHRPSGHSLIRASRASGCPVVGPTITSSRCWTYVRMTQRARRPA